ncbi:hypothetical protein ACFQ3F_21340 [Nocardioides ginsengisoli]|uniref:Uncharacterized protein n=1 Tax=Nocardioides ginsengisoli TaxID=363868 RepID=A0ABW3W4Y1_9ACTN
MPSTASDLVERSNALLSAIDEITSNPGLSVREDLIAIAGQAAVVSLRTAQLVQQLEDRVARLEGH